MSMMIRVLLLFAAAYTGASCAQEPVLYDGTDGATCDYFNQGVRIQWVHRAGDWLDANGAEQGSVPFAQLAVADSGRPQTLRWDVSQLAAAWIDHVYPNQGMLLRTVPGSRPGAVALNSREQEDVNVRPKLILDFADGKRITSYPMADTSIDCSTVYSIGSRKVLTVSNQVNLLIRFDLQLANAGAKLAKATLELASPKQYASTVVGVYRMDPPLHNDPSPAEMGLAAQYHRDRGIDKDPAVLMATGFESPLWRRDWSEVDLRGTTDRTDREGVLGFQAHDGNALRVEIPKGKNLGLNVSYKFADKIGHEPEEIYFRYYLRLAGDWSPTTDGGKFPGISGTYGRAGWGGRTSDGTNGWSMRGSFFAEPSPANPYHLMTLIGTYAYHADTKDFWGDQWPWSIKQRGLLERNRWYCIEQYVKINHVGKKDAVMRAWVDGRLALDETGFRVRTIDTLKIEEIWMNVYYGGTAPSPQDQHLFIDNVVIASQYIGPMRD